MCKVFLTGFIVFVDPEENSIRAFHLIITAVMSVFTCISLHTPIPANTKMMSTLDLLVALFLFVFTLCIVCDNNYNILVPTISGAHYAYTSHSPFNTRHID